MKKVRILMVAVLGVLAVSGNAGAAHQKNLACYDAERNPLAAPETEQFAFLIGAFESKLYPWSQENGDWADEPITTALWQGEYILDGTGIADYWYDSDPGVTADTNRGVNTRVYNAETGEWNMTWNTWGKNPKTTTLTAKMIEGVLTMWQVLPEPEQKRVSEFITNTKDHWTRYTFVEEGEERIPFFKIESVRIPCQQ